MKQDEKLKDGTFNVKECSCKVAVPVTEDVNCKAKNTAATIKDCVTTDSETSGKKCCLLNFAQCETNSDPAVGSAKAGCRIFTDVASGTTLKSEGKYCFGPGKGVKLLDGIQSINGNDICARTPGMSWTAEYKADADAIDDPVKKSTYMTASCSCKDDMPAPKLDDNCAGVSDSSNIASCTTTDSSEPGKKCCLLTFQKCDRETDKKECNGDKLTDAGSGKKSICYGPG